jgi:tyrosyl-tRNA synthetase
MFQNGDKKTPSVYIGFDPTAESIHIGNFLGLVVLTHFRIAGFQPIVLFGGATGLIGDPSGRETERTLLHEDQVASNIDAF